MQTFTASCFACWHGIEVDQPHLHATVRRRWRNGKLSTQTRTYPFHLGCFERWLAQGEPREPGVTFTVEHCRLVEPWSTRSGGLLALV